MDASFLVMWIGFILASYSVVGNDVIQTLGTFLTSNEKRVKWYILWAFASAVMVYALVNGYVNEDVTVHYGRLDKFDLDNITYNWSYIIPPLVLLLITRSGIPVSTTFMVLTLFSLSEIPTDLGLMFESVYSKSIVVNGETEKSILYGMINKSIMGYLIAFSSAVVIYLLVTRLTEKRFIDNPLSETERPFWITAQWLTTGFLWYQWLTQDLANIYIYLQGGNNLSVGSFTISVLILVGLLGYIFYSAGGKVQDVVRSKTNTADIRAATFVDLIYGIILFVFKDNYLGLFEGKLPMSTTWIFIGLLAGRELGIRLNLEKKISKATARMVFSDLGKVFFGLVVSVVLVFIIKLLNG